MVSYLFTAADRYLLTLVFLLVFTEGGEWDPSSLAISVSPCLFTASIIWLWLLITFMFLEQSSQA